MPYIPTLNYTITGAQETTIIGELEASKDALGAIATVTLSDTEAAALNKVDNSRLPFVQRAVQEFGATYTALASERVTTTRALDLFEAIIVLRKLEGLLKEYQDRVKDLSFNTEHILYLYTIDMYEKAKRYRGDIEGADVVADYLSEMFEGQGPQNPPTPPTE